MKNETGSDILLDTIVAGYVAELGARAKPRSVHSAKLAWQRMSKALGWKRVRDVSKSELAAFRLERIAAGASNKTVNNEVATLRAALAFAERLDLIGWDPLARFRMLPVTGRHQRRRTRALSDAELRSLFKAAAQEDARSDKFPRAPLIRALALTGARWAEMISVTWADLDEDAKTLRLRAETTKTGLERIVPLDPLIVADLPALRRAHEALTGMKARPRTRIFLSPKGKPWPEHTGNFRKYLAEIYVKAGIATIDPTGRHAHIHALRHTFTTRLARAGIGIQVAQKLTGHRTAAVLIDVYSHIETEDCRKALESLPSI